MARGVVPRQPARTGRQDKVRVKNAHVGTGALARRGRGKVSAAAPKGRQSAAGKSAPTSAPKLEGYNPVAPERVAEDSETPGPTLSGRQVRTHARQRMGTAGGDDSLGAIDRREREPRDTGAIPQVSDGRGICRAHARATRARCALDRILPQ